MPRPRGSELAHQRQSPRPPLHLRSTASSDANSIYRDAINRRSKLDDLHEQRNRGSKEADLEKKLSETLEGVKKMKEQLALAEAAKRDAQNELEKKKKLVIFNPPVGEHENSPPIEEDNISSLTTDLSPLSPATSDVGSSQLLEKSLIEGRENKDEEEVEIKKIRAMLESTLEKKENLRKDAEELARKLAVAEEDLRRSRAMGERLMMKLQAGEEEKASLEAEMKSLRVQADQWRKAAEAAAAVLASCDGPATADRTGLTDKFMGDYEHGGRKWWNQKIW
ncbi:Interactor of constitutive active ROPs 1 [Apostasia shenzhenica]|uniref:Interactor of constitutive active ROPs 1 n=1 Tax=Apostasia shenzhenica TaxID=1088818 RepID=A0A2I0BFI2_9ASPA|nr:Interactor of constitutive active ROPs 1 [Apostasia shenzhenica]